MMNSDLPEMADYVATCLTGGCFNEGEAIDVQATAEDPFVVCGPCGQRITDVTPIDQPTG